VTVPNASTTVAGSVPTTMAKSTTLPLTNGDGFCGDWGKAAQAVAAVSKPSTGAATDASAGLKDIGTYFSAMAKVAPAEIKADFTRYATFYEKFATAMAPYAGDYTKAFTDPAMQKMITEMSSTDLMQASTHITTWVMANWTGGTK
jgi:hypothetical protein